MLAKLNANNQLTLPEAVTQALGPVEYFEVEARDGRIVLTPVRIERVDAVRATLADLGIAADDVEDAVEWVRAVRSDASAPKTRRASAARNVRHRKS